MAPFVLTNANLYVAEYDFSSDHNQIGLRLGVDEKDTTTFGSSGFRSRIGGLRSYMLSGGGFVQYGAGEVDPVYFDNLGVADKLVTVAADGADAGEVAYFGRTTQGQMEFGDRVGEVMPFSIEAWGRGTPCVRGTVMHDDGTARTSTGTGTAYQLGAVGAGQYLYAAIHVLSASGTTPSLTVKVQSDNASNFPSATDRVTFTAATTATSEWATPVAGAITDDYWRVTWTISGTNPSFTFVAVVGIL